MTTTYGDYSGIIIKKVICVVATCRGAIKKYNLQQLLDKEDARCPKCEAQRPKKDTIETAYGTFRPRTADEDHVQRASDDR